MLKYVTVFLAGALAPLLGMVVLSFIFKPSPHPQRKNKFYDYK